MLPQVTVLQVPAALYDYPPLVLKDGLFDTLRVTAEDKKRAQLYQHESQRKGARSNFASLDDYLASLGTVAAIHRVKPNEIARVAQLTQKTNQFNLTTRRYSEQDIQGFTSRADSAVFALSVKDKFGQLGLVGVLILTHRDDGRDRQLSTELPSARARARIGHAGLLPRSHAAGLEPGELDGGIHPDAQEPAGRRFLADTRLHPNRWHRRA
jgi:FkbH-like protein